MYWNILVDEDRRSYHMTKAAFIACAREVVNARLDQVALCSNGQ